jgi:hypothetical protein
MATRIFIATPTRDMTVHAAYQFSMRRLCATPPCELAVPTSMYDGDIVRVRSRYVQDFLESDSTHLLFVDADIDFLPVVVDGLLAAREDFVAAPYRHKREGNSYPVVLEPGLSPRIDPQRHIVEIAGIGIGMALLSRSMLERMVEHYRGLDLSFIDNPNERHARRATVALFQLVIVDGNLYSEDLSFAWRWRKMGGKVWMYLGPGSPVGHHGVHRFTGSLADFGAAPP